MEAVNDSEARKSELILLLEALDSDQPCNAT